MALRYYQPGDYDNTILRKLLENQAQLITGALTLHVTGGGSGSPAGVNGDLQFNDGGVFGGLSPGADGNVLQVVGGEWVSAPGLTAVAWGDVTGTLADQTDLQAELDAKANVADLGTMANLTAPTLVPLPGTTGSVNFSNGPAPFQFTYTGTLTGDLDIVDATAPNEGDGHAFILAAGSTARTISFTSSISEAQGGAILSFVLAANAEITFARRYVNGAWRIQGDPAPLAAGEQPQVKIFQRLGATAAIAQTCDIDACTTGSTMSDNSLYLIPVYVPTAKLASAISWMQVAAMSTTAEALGNRLGLYSCAANGDLTLIASTANAPLTWDQGNNTWTSRGFSTPIIIQPGVYYIGALYNVTAAGGTAPSILARAALLTSVMAQPTFLTTNFKTACTLAAQSDLPNGPFNLSTTVASNTWRYFLLR